MKITCPNCNTELDSPSIINDGDNVSCSECGHKFAYQLQHRATPPPIHEAVDQQSSNGDAIGSAESYSSFVFAVGWVAIISAFIALICALAFSAQDPEKVFPSICVFCGGLSAGLSFLFFGHLLRMTTIIAKRK